MKEKVNRLFPLNPGMQGNSGEKNGTLINSWYASKIFQNWELLTSPSCLAQSAGGIKQPDLNSLNPLTSMRNSPEFNEVNL